MLQENTNSKTFLKQSDTFFVQFVLQLVEQLLFVAWRHISEMSRVHHPQKDTLLKNRLHLFSQHQHYLDT